MQTIEEIRRARLALLETEAGSQSELASVIEKAPAQISQWKNASRTATGRGRAMSSDIARDIERACNKPRGWMDQPLDVEEPLHTADVASGYDIDPSSVLHIPLLANPGSMGNGEPDLHDDVFIGELTVSREWVLREVRPTSVRALRFMHGCGESMFPTFRDGDVLLVDMEARNPDANGGIYALRVDDDVFIKRVRRRMDGQFEVSSDNPAVKTVDVLDGTRPLSVVGRAIWVWNGKKI